MRLTGLDLQGYRCFPGASLAFEPGVTVIHGQNGAGKTTLLEAVLFGLYGANALGDATLADVFTTGIDETRVQLTFVHAGGDYRIDRAIVDHGERASTRTCELTEPNGTVVEGARAVRERVTELLRMDADAFVNSAYVKQGEINKLLHASPRERQSMIDELLQLGRLEAYRDRADQARLAVRSLRRERDERLAEIDAQLAPLRDADPYERLNALESERKAVLSTLEAATERRDEIASTRGDLVDAIEEIESTRAERERLVEQRDEVRTAVEAAEQERTELRTSIDEHRKTADDIDERIDAICADADLAGPEDCEQARERIAERRDETEADLETARERIESIQAEAAEIRERRSSLSERLDRRRDEFRSLDEAITEDEAVIDDREASIETLEAQMEDRGEAIRGWPLDATAIDERRTTLREAHEKHVKRRQTVSERIAALSKHLEHAESLAAEDRCPTCGQPVDASPHLETLDDDRDELDASRDERDAIEATIEEIEAERSAVEEVSDLMDNRSAIEQLVDERAAAVEERHDRRDEVAETIDSLEKAIESTATDLEDIESKLVEAREAVATCNRTMQTLREREATLDAIADAVDERTNIDAEIERLRERREHLVALNEERLDRLDELESRLEDLGDVDDEKLTRARERVEELDATIADIDETITDAETERDQLNEHIGATRTDIDQLESLQERRAAIEDRHAALADVEGEATELGDLYGAVRAELRERNVATLERLLNETFDLLYRNDAYDRLHLESDYSLAVSQKDGERLEPMQLSGGERAIFNLSLRCAIYRLLAEGVDGAAPMPPLMLDEPTVFLDEGHVGRLIRLLETMRELGVEQTLVVSHHEALLDAAEHLVAVEKDPTSNRSTVHTRATPSPTQP